jgi:hypothetical protein
LDFVQYPEFLIPRKQKVSEIGPVSAFRRRDRRPFLETANPDHWIFLKDPRE